MKKYFIFLSLVFFSACAHKRVQTPGVLLENLTWSEAEPLLNQNSIVVIPLGGAAKEHGPHLTLQNDFLIAEYLKKEILKTESVLMAPTVNYGFYPAFVEYPGSVSLKIETARDLIVDICESYARFGVKKFYVLNTGVSTVRSLKLSESVLAKKGLTLKYTNLIEAMGETEKEIAKQEGGTHAEETETSMMLIMAPKTVNMKLAVKDYTPGSGPLTRDPHNKKGVYSPTGIWGDARLATEAKGRRLVDAYLSGIRRDLSALRLQP